MIPYVEDPGARCSTEASQERVSGNGGKHRDTYSQREWSGARCPDSEYPECDVEPCPRHDPEDYAALSRAERGARHKKGGE